MKNIEILIAKKIVKILDLLTCRLNSRANKITYISYTSDKLPQNMKLISKNIKKLNEEYEEVYLTIKYKNTIYDKLRYMIEIVKQIYHIKTSKVVIIDGNNFVISNIEKKDTKVIQIWHACGAIKKFGKDFTRKYDIENYDYIITSSTKSKTIMASAFGMKEEQVLTLGCARTDILFKKKKMDRYKEEMYTKYPQFKDKKIVLYAPTFRGEGVYEKKSLDIDIEKISKKIGDEYIVLYKHHPIIGRYKSYNGSNVYDVSEESLYKLFSISDILISDFSAIIYDFSILEKPIILFVPDLENYKKERGLYIDYEEFAPGKIAYSEDELVQVIKSGDFEVDKVKKLKNEFFDFLDGNSAKRIAKFIESISND